MNLNLDSLKHEILEYLDSAGLAVFYGESGGLEGIPMILWDSERFPDYRMFLDVARKMGTRVTIFASTELESGDLDELSEQLDELELPRDERKDFESRIRQLRMYQGVTCSIELAYDIDGRLYVYQIQPDWYEDFINLEDELAANSPDEDEEFNGGDSLGGYYSKN